MKKMLFVAVAAVTMGAQAYAPAKSPLMTEWGEKVTPENAWREYPRPQMVRDNWTNLNGEWNYAVTAITNAVGRPKSWDGKILVPFGIEAPLSGVGRLLKPDEFLWYTRKIEVKGKGEGRKRILLNFESVDFRAQVFIGHREVELPHESMNVPFSLDITDYVVDGENELTVCVWDPSDSGAFGATGKQFLKPRACFYTRCSGILGSVWMETVPASYVTDYRVTPDLKRGTVRFRVLANNWRETKCRVEVLESGRTVSTGTGIVGEDFEIAMPKGFRTWTPETPNLYDFRLTLGADVVMGYFAMRSFAKEKDGKGILRFALNGKPTFVAATLDQGWWPDGLLTPPSSEAIAYEIKTLKSCGFNALRKHIKVEPRVYYALCDRLGIMVLQDMPSDPPPHDGSQAPDDGFATDTTRYGFYRRDLKRVVDHLYNVPSIVMWIPYNESWGQPGRFLTHATLDWVKAYDPSRLVNGPSGWNDYEGGVFRADYKVWKLCPSEHLPADVCEAADVIDRHDYGKKPMVFPANDRRISFLGEFGGINLKVNDHLWDAKGHFGYEQRESAEELQKAYVEILNHVGTLVPDGLSGFVYTQTTDVEIETNGLLTYDRKVLKFDPMVLRATHERVNRAMGR